MGEKCTPHRLQAKIFSQLHACLVCLTNSQVRASRYIDLYISKHRNRRHADTTWRGPVTRQPVWPAAPPNPAAGQAISSDISVKMMHSLTLTLRGSAFVIDRPIGRSRDPRQHEVKKGAGGFFPHRQLLLLGPRGRFSMAADRTFPNIHVAATATIVRARNEE
jgi:hypothetical protein